MRTNYCYANQNSGRDPLSERAYLMYLTVYSALLSAIPNPASSKYLRKTISFKKLKYLTVVCKYIQISSKNLNVKLKKV